MQSFNMQTITNLMRPSAQEQIDHITRLNSTKPAASDKINQFIRSLESKNAPNELNFSGCKVDGTYANRTIMTIDDFRALNFILKNYQLSEDFTLNLKEANVSEEGIQLIANALESKNCPKNFKLILRRTKITNHEADILARALKSGHCPVGFELILSHTGIGKPGMQAIIDALPFCPEQFKLDISGGKVITEPYQPAPSRTFKSIPWNYWYDSVYSVLINPIKTQQSKHWPKDFHLCLDQFLPLIATMTDGLKEGSFPEGFKIEFTEFNHSKTSIAADNQLIAALSSQRCPERISINHKFPPYKKRLSIFSKYPMTELIRKGKYPHGLHLDLSDHAYDHKWPPRDSRVCPAVSELKANDALAKALIDNSGPSFALTMDFIVTDQWGETYEVPGWEVIVDALKYNKTLSTLTLSNINLPMAKNLLQIYKVNDTLTELSFVYQSDVPDVLVEEMQKMGNKNKGSKINKELVQYFTPPGLSKIVLDYLDLANRQMPIEATMSLEKNDFYTFYLILKRNENIFDSTIKKNDKSIKLGEYTKNFMTLMATALDKQSFAFINKKLKAYDKQLQSFLDKNNNGLWKSLSLTDSSHKTDDVEQKQSYKNR